MTIDFTAMRQTLAPGRRLSTLHSNAYQVRQISLGARGDLEGWQIARLMRDAATLPQINTAERRLKIWLQIRSLKLPQAA
ncbi:hypothetical protein [Rhodopseudomonas sp. P2A-2r]|uniref:hypothetical protein n=1 Tax=unclassified Rhodopseudomonas TaxID=2638247 RepID=UPI00223400BD|nr:hypothetical protein [Rhodopseudomonas sp. P2A-2r]UZE46873.1 hypothetical protein ONR75_17715 [Rhodopseudomonas sp. P2A-2r]